ncbi:trans-4-hydroxy-L-proline dehydratase [Paraclostridium sordellii]|uniref:trans-4-hydroxy-L-proline dehydratase n=1 Tax=Paraclostridium sordellii TaxID=1505 RepID=UPI0005DB1840|nr:trans-4-hydroxy-L-proline dehydratase [Paeniclostridium sordellii]MCQ4698651.1 glycyl radical protein [Paeniclostridium sordellii]CEN25644.1 pyruvate formate-lyase [[Clostridium] sordellii] [Paeniclostridium sordellii]CEN30034.1 pyruvate formate-lyase [[Clostridium] sordellii] [Paeniclostridium sordellii]CEN30848.1 pyruvate formate-lyase [[Clostridium] sordellii] [Paeniclostridium sordellii]CEP46224.1 pyruvate formate-lyase [[Clostridium] sordellii] [Paeniclostridium sordellii]
MQRGSFERTKKLRKQSLDTQPFITIERARLMTEGYKKYEGSVEIPVLRALAFKHYMENRTLCINEGELIVGEKGDSPQSTPTYPELCCHTMEDLDIMDRRDIISFKVSDDVKKIHEEEIIPFWKNRQIRAKIVNSMEKEWLDCYENGVFTEFMEQRAPGHTVCGGEIYKKGFKDFKQEIIDEIEKLDFVNDKDAYDKKAQLEAMSIACDAIMIYGKRYAEYARELAQKETDENKKKDLLLIASNCDVVPANKPQTFHQAVQMYWFVHVGVTTELNIWDAFSPGRFDQHLNPFYENDINENRIDRDNAKEILECLWVKFNNQPAPPKVGVTLKESGTYTDFANINTGGITEDGKDGVNDVSYIILDVMDEMKLLQPSSNVQISKKTPSKFLKRACEISRKGWGQPAFYNTEAIIQELLEAGKTIEDARCGGTSGCVETGCYGKEAYILTGYLNLPKILEITLNNGLDPVSKKQLGIKTGDAREFKSYDELFNAFKSQLNHFVDIKVKGNNAIERIYSKHMPAPLMSVIVDDCIKNAKDYNAGGARYNTKYIQGVGIGTITDSLTSIKYNVFDKKKFNMEDLLNALSDNFEGHEAIYNMVVNKTPKYGNDDDYADELMQDVFNSFYNEVTGRISPMGAQYRINMLPTTCHVYFGEVMGASANGRLSQKPLSEGISPEKGGDTNGPTAVIKSCSKMDHLKTGGTLLNQRFAPAVVQGEDGLDNMANLVRAYFNMDGHHIQFNVFDKNVLLAAQKNPEEYKDLIVRVAGYSDHFNNLSRALQDEIIGRTEQTF